MEAGVQLIKRYPLLNISHPQVIFHILECATHVSFRQNFGHQPILNRFMWHLKHPFIWNLNRLRLQTRLFKSFDAK